MRKTKKPANLIPEPPPSNVSDFQKKLSRLLKEEAECTMIALRHEDEREEAEKALAEAKTQMRQARNTLFSNLREKNPDLVDFLAPQHSHTCEGSDKYPDSDCIRCTLLAGQVGNIEIQLKWEEV